ncbi:MAG: hypothetical protein R6W90_00420 [Ignavibacteriaceae bacterium]
MKNIIFSLLILTAISLVSISCSSGPINKITFKNSAQGNVSVNFRGSTISVPAGRTVEVKDVTPGTYNYSTTYTLPVGATNYNASGAVSGSLVMKGGTRILIHYSSTLIDGTYTIFGTISSSDSNDDGVTEP